MRYVFLLLCLGLLTGLIVIAGNGHGAASNAPRSTVSAPPAASRTYALLAGIPQHGAVLGSREAPVTLQFFGDLQCINSRRVMLGALPFLIRHWVREGKLQIRFRSLETDTRLAGGWYEFREQQTAALAAGRQGKLWNFIDVFYREQGPEGAGYVDEEFLTRIASEAGLDLEAWSNDIAPFQSSWVRRSKIERAMAWRRRLNTPGFLIGRTGGPASTLRHFSLEESDVFDEAIRALLKGTQTL